ncbi:MAG: hypothetical protein U9N86_09325 [Bacteroidota bacterium]|nr:hypothetical protein [Bacteroidota bacterium]
MKTLNSYKYSFSLSWRSKKLTSIVYLAYLIIALLLTIPFYKLFSSISEYSLLPANLLKGFDATAFGDLIRDSGKVFQVYFKGLLPWLIVFWLFGTFFYGGIIDWIANPKGSLRLRSFLDKSTKYFWRFLRIAFYILIVQVVFAFLIYLIPVILIGKEGMTDQYIVRTLTIGILIHLVFMITISLIADFTRFGLYQKSHHKVLREMWKSFKFVFRHLGSLWMIYLMWVIMPIALMVLFYFIRTSMNIDATGLIIGLFVIQQVFVWLRFCLRIQKQGMFFKYYLCFQIYH